mgnify:CR=1 FL=1
MANQIQMLDRVGKEVSVVAEMMLLHYKDSKRMHKRLMDRKKVKTKEESQPNSSFCLSSVLELEIAKLSSSSHKTTTSEMRKWELNHSQKEQRNILKWLLIMSILWQQSIWQSCF